MSEVKTIGGIAQLRIGDQMLHYRDGLKHNFQRYVTAGVMGRDATFHGWTKKPHVPSIEGEFTHMPGWTTAQYEALVGDLIASKIDGAGTLVLRDAKVVGEIDIDDDEGKVKLKFEGSGGEELSA